MTPPPASPPPLAIGTTLLALVTRVSDRSESIDETVETVLALLDSGWIYLTGSFRGWQLSERAPSPRRR